MNASMRGILSVKADRVDDRIDVCAKKFLNRYGDNVNKDNFKEFVQLVHIIVDTELNEKGVERVWKE